MLDLTGAPYASIRFEDPDVQDRFKSGKLWEELVHWATLNLTLTLNLILTLT